MSDIVDDFISLFRGRGDCYGSWEGGCVRLPLTRGVFEKHLYSNDPADWIGVYPCMGALCSWGCIDIDFDDINLAYRLKEALAYKKITGWIEKTTHGYHVWVFPEEPLVASATMRRALMAACLSQGYEPKEVNPKSEDVGPGPGNYVRAPHNSELHGYTVLSERYMVGFGSLIDFLDLATLNRTPTANLEAVAKLWTPPVAAQYDGVIPSVDKTLTDKMSPKAWHIWNNGPLEGSDRSSTTFRLACLLREDGLDPNETHAILKAIPVGWSKYHGRKDEDRIISDLIGRAYGN